MKRLRVLLLPGLFTLLLAGLTAYNAYNYTAGLRLSRATLQHSRDVIAATQKVFSLIQDAETSQRGYLLTGGDAYLGPYEDALEEAPIWQARLTDLASADPHQRAAVAKLNGSVRDKMAELAQTVALARAGHRQEAEAIVYADRGRVLMDGLRDEVATVLKAEEASLDLRSRRARDQVDRGFLVSLVLGGLALVGLAWTVLALWRANTKLTQEIAVRRAAEADRDESNAVRQAMFENAADYLYVVDVLPDGRFAMAEMNPAIEAVMKVKVDRIRRRPLNELVPAEAAEALESHYRRVCASDRPVITRDVMPFPEGPRTWESILSPVRGPDGKPYRIIGASRDITDRIQAEEQLRRAQRMEVIGQLTGGVAHDFNNLLQVIRGNLELMEPGLADDPRMARRLQNALHGAERAGQLTRQLLAFARRQPLEPKPVNLGRLAGEMGDLLRRTLGETIEVEIVVGGGLWNTLADPAQVESAVLNLAINARDAMPDGGRLTIELSNASLDDSYAQKVGDLRAGQYVLLAVSDTGQGMDAAVMERVFEPFFTTKTDGRGSGLGMSMVYGFVKQSGGHIQLYSEPGQGTTAKIYLPRTRQPLAGPDLAQMPASAGGGELILVVEDEPEVRAAAIAMLEDLGYRCIEARDTASGLAAAEREPDIDLVFSDVVMPGPMKTRDMADKIKALRPDLPILFTSGYTANAIVHHGRLDDGVHLLSKPYSKADLGAKVAALLAASA